MIVIILKAKTCWEKLDRESSKITYKLLLKLKQNLKWCPTNTPEQFSASYVNYRPDDVTVYIVLKDKGTILVTKQLYHCLFKHNTFISPDKLFKVAPAIHGKWSMLHVTMARGALWEHAYWVYNMPATYM